MDIHSIRRRNLQRYIDDNRDGDQTRFARELWPEKNPSNQSSRISQLLSGTFRQGKNFGEKVARQIEERAEMPVGYLDREFPTPSGGLAISSEGFIPLLGDETLGIRSTHSTDELVAVMNTCGFAPEKYVAPQGYVGVRLYAPPLRETPEGAFAVICAGNEADPVLETGQALVLSDRVEPAMGDLCVVEVEGKWRLAVFGGASKTGGLSFRDRLDKEKKKFVELDARVYTVLGIFNESRLIEKEVS